MIITAGGENIPPVVIEHEMKAAMTAISNVMVVGDRRKYLSLLVSLKALPSDDGSEELLLAPEALAIGQQLDSTARLYSEAQVDPLWITYINTGIQEANKKATSHAQFIQNWRWLPEDFSERTGELTPTLKLKRKVVLEKYAVLIDAIYAEDH